MERSIDLQIEELKRSILSMGGHVEKALDIAINALENREPDKFALVHDLEKTINEEHINIDNQCISLLAKQGPVAKDLRLIVSVVKINSDLERMGDQSVNISHSGRDYLARNPVPESKLIRQMGDSVKKMVAGSLDSFVRSDLELAKKILLMDDEVDELKNRVFHQLAAYMKQNPQDVEASLDVILMARNLERLGDHATNIAEDVIYAVTGRDIRHGGKYDR